LTPGAAPADSDGDGMPNAWENSRGLNPNSAADVHTALPGGYPAIETYINELADALVPSCWKETRSILPAIPIAPPTHPRTIRPAVPIAPPTHPRDILPAVPIALPKRPSAGTAAPQAKTLRKRK
jgi:hypothetical protein